MINDKFSLYWIMYVYIEEYFQNNATDSVEQFLSDGNPFIWEKQTWDPSLNDKFVNLFESDGTYDSNGFEFIIKFLNELDNIYIDVKRLSNRLNKDQYVEKTNLIYKNGFNFYLEKYGLKR